MSKYKATVFIPTFNGETYLGDILRMVFSQEVNFDYEVLIIDSGSTDSTLAIIEKYKKKHKNLRLLQIPNSEFGHGKTRQRAAELADGEFVVYITHDAIPAHKHWLEEMLAPFALNDKVMAVLGKQDPRVGCFPLMKYDIQGVFSNLGSGYAGVTLYYDGSFIKDQGTRDLASFYSDVNSATRRDFLLNKIPYRDVPYAEDQLFGSEVIKAGYIKAYNPRANVWHSNDIPLKEYKSRIFDETVGLRRTGQTMVPPSFLGSFKHMLFDEIRILRDGQFSRKRKLYWLAINPLYHHQLRRGRVLGCKNNVTQSDVDKHSLEASKRASHARTARED